MRGRSRAKSSPTACWARSSTTAPARARPTSSMPTCSPTAGARAAPATTFTRRSMRRARAPLAPSVEGAPAALRAHLAGVKVIATDTTSKTIRFGDFDYVRELIVVDVYITSPPIDPEQDAAIAPPWSTLPWHVIVLMEEAVTRGLAAFSQGEAARRGVP